MDFSNEEKLKKKAGRNKVDKYTISSSSGCIFFINLIMNESWHTKLSPACVHQYLNESLEAGNSMAADVGTNVFCISLPQLEILIHRHEKNQNYFPPFPPFFFLSFLFISPFKSQRKTVNQQKSVGCGIGGTQTIAQKIR